jgi:putative tryptophan/tyrosine transport system substrate-binding protein
MRRREFIGLVGAIAALKPVAALAQVSGRPLIGVLSPTAPSLAVPMFDALRAGLREHGYIEGRNVWMEFRYANGVPERLPGLAAELVARKPDLIIAGSTPGIIAAQGATRIIPIAMISLFDPVPLGLVKSLAQPGGNVTGIFTFGGNDALISKRLDLLKEITPGMVQVGVLVSAQDQLTHVLSALLPAATRALGLTYKVYSVRNDVEVDTAITQAKRDGMNGLFVDQSPFFLSRRTEVAALVARAGIPTIYGYREHAEAGGLIAYGSSLSGAYRQLGRFVDKILKGTSPSVIPVEQADKFELVVNNKAAKELGLKISEAFLLRADDVIE